MELPPEIREAVRKAEEKHPGDVGKAKSAAIKAVRALPLCEEWVQLLVDSAIESALYEARHARAVAMRRQEAFYGRPGKVNAASSAAVERVYESVYQYRIGGTVLGDLTGERLPEIIAREGEAAATHTFHARLLTWVQEQGIGDEQAVRDVIPEKKLADAFERLKKATGTDRTA